MCFNVIPKWSIQKFSKFFPYKIILKLSSKALMCFYLYCQLTSKFHIEYVLSQLSCFHPQLSRLVTVLRVAPLRLFSLGFPTLFLVLRPVCIRLTPRFVFLFSPRILCVFVFRVFFSAALCCSAQQLMMICVLFPLLHYKCPVRCCSRCCCHSHRFDYLGFNLYYCSIVVVAFFPPLLALPSAVIVDTVDITLRQQALVQCNCLWTTAKT